MHCNYNDDGIACSWDPPCNSGALLAAVAAAAGIVLLDAIVLFAVR